MQKAPFMVRFVVKIINKSLEIKGNTVIYHEVTHFMVNQLYSLPILSLPPEEKNITRESGNKRYCAGEEMEAEIMDERIIVDGGSPEKQKPLPVLTAEVINKFLEVRRQSGCHEKTYRQDRTTARCLYDFLPEDKILTQERLESFRQELRGKGYAATTISAWSKSVNHLMEYLGMPDIRLGKGNPYDLTGRRYGSLVVLSLTEKKYRSNHVWLCRCVCGNEIEVPSTSLTLGNTTSCGCLKKNVLRAANRYIDATSLRQSLADDQVHSSRASSGYTGVVPRGDKWRAVIRYKGKTHYLGTYTRIEDAVKARAEAKRQVQDDALGLEQIYQELHAGEEMPHRPAKPEAYIRQTSDLPKEEKPVRIDNTSGCTGVNKRKDKWSASITVSGKRYFLGCYKALDEAIAVRKQAEKYLERQDMGALEAMCRTNTQEEFNGKRKDNDNT